MLTAPETLPASLVFSRLVADYQDGRFAEQWVAVSARGSSWLSTDERRLAHYLTADNALAAG